jgi:peptide/nickel transport system substrate-binding protein
VRTTPGRPCIRTLAAGALLALLAGPVLGGCRPDRPGKGTLVVALDGAPEELDPRLLASAYSFKVSRLVFAALTDDDVPPTAQGPRLGLAESIVREDDRTYLVTLRPGLKFHDGHPLTADDVAYTFRSVRDPSVGSRLRKSYERITAIDVVDARRVRFRIDGPHAPFVTDLNLGIVPRHILEPRSGKFGDAPRIGAGPFKVVSWTSDRVVLERHPAYHRGAPPLSQVVFRTLRDDNARVLALVGGSADLTQNSVSPLVLDQVLRWRKLSLQSGPSNLWSYLAVNLREPALADVRVRRALAHALDREKLISAKFGGRARLSSSYLPPGHWAHEPRVATYAHDPARARQLLDEAGLRPGPDGVRLRLVMKTTTSNFQFSLCRAMAAQLAEVGVQLELRRYEFATFFADVKRGNFEIYTAQIPEVAEPDLAHFFFHSSRIPTARDPDAGGNRWAYNVPRMDALLDAGRRELDPARRRTVYSEVQRLLAEDLPVIPLWHVDNVAVLRSEVRDFQVVPSARFGSLERTWKQGAGRPAGGSTSQPGAATMPAP